MTTDLADTILARSDAGEFPEAIAASSGMSLSYVYRVLRKERPERVRKPRRQTSELRDQVKSLLAAGIKPRRAAELLEISRTYAYRIASEPNVS